MERAELTAAECRELAIDAVKLTRDREKLVSHAEDFARRVEVTNEYIAARITDPVPPDLDELLWDLGWAIYEQSWEISDRIDAQFSSAAEEALAECARRLANTAERLPRRDRAPRAGGALRAYALVLSKRDTDEGYERANAQHLGADQWLDVVRRTVERDDRLRLACDELRVQFETAKAGTACRRVETFLCDPLRLESGFTPRQVLKLTASSTRDAIKAGVGSLLELRRLPPVAETDGPRERLLQPRWARQPANMAARAHLLMAASVAALNDMGEPWAPHSEELWTLHSEFARVQVGSPTDHESELALHRSALAQFIEVAEQAALKAFFRGGDLEPRHVAEMARIRLHLHIQFPELRAPPVPDHVPYQRVVAGEARGHAAARYPHPSTVPIEGLSRWLAANGQDANVVGTARHEEWIAGLEGLREREVQRKGELWPYSDWRSAFPELARNHLRRPNPLTVEPIGK